MANTTIYSFGFCRHRTPRPSSSFCALVSRRQEDLEQIDDAQPLLGQLQLHHRRCGFLGVNGSVLTSIRMGRQLQRFLIQLFDEPVLEDCEHTIHFAASDGIARQAELVMNQLACLIHLGGVAVLAQWR